MTSTPSKLFSLLSTATIVGGIAALASQFYRHPIETVNALSRVGMRLAGVREGVCDLQGTTMHYYCAGRRGLPIVLIHGLGNTAEVWASLFPFLRNDFLVYAPDLPGFGLTSASKEGFTIRTHVLYLERFLDALGYPRVILLGNSLGGWIATQFAATHPERVEHLFLLNSAGLRRENTVSPYAINRLSAQHSMDRIWGYHVPLPNFLLDAVVRTSRMQAYEGFISSYDVAEELDTVLPQVQTPTTIMWGERDGLFPLSCAYEFQKGIRNSRLIVFKHIGHMPQVQAPRQVARVVTTIL